MVNYPVRIVASDSNPFSAGFEVRHGEETMLAVDGGLIKGIFS